MLPFLQRISVYVNRVQLVVKKVVQQLASVHSARPAAQCIDPTDVHFEKVFTLVALRANTPPPTHTHTASFISLSLSLSLSLSFVLCLLLT